MKSLDVRAKGKDLNQKSERKKEVAESRFMYGILEPATLCLSNRAEVNLKQGHTA